MLEPIEHFGAELPQQRFADTQSNQRNIMDAVRRMLDNFPPS